MQARHEGPTFPSFTFGKGVIVGVDPVAHNASAIEWATAQAAGSGRPLRLVDVVAQDGDPDGATRARHLLAMVAADLREVSPGTDVSEIVVAGPRIRSLITQADGESLLVVGRRAARPFESRSPGSTAVGVACESPIPVVVVPDEWRQEQHAAEPVMVCVDPFQDSGYPLGIAFTEARRRRVGLEVVHVIPAPSAVPATGRSRYVVDAALRALEAVVARHRASCPDVTVRVTARGGTPETVVTASADGAQLLVVGRHRRRRRSLLWGTFVPAATEGLPLPVAVIPDRVQLCPWAG